RIVPGELPCDPLAHPDAPAAVAPYAARTLPARGGLDHLRFAALQVDARDEGIGERAVPDIARGRRADAVRPSPTRRVPHLDLAGLHVHLAVDTALAGKPHVAV